MLGVCVSQQSSDFLDGHDGSCQKTLCDTDFSLDQILHGCDAEFVLENADDVHFRDTEFFGNQVERQLVINICVNERTDSFGK